MIAVTLVSCITYTLSRNQYVVLTVHLSLDGPCRLVRTAVACFGIVINSSCVSDDQILADLFALGLDAKRERRYTSVTTEFR